MNEIDPKTVRPAADLAHAAEDVRKYLALRAHAVNDEVLDSPEVVSVARDETSSHALMETVVRTLLAERDILAAYVDQQVLTVQSSDGAEHEAADAAARLQAWFKAEGPLAMDEADFDDVQAVLADHQRVVTERGLLRARVAELEAYPWDVATEEDEQPQDERDGDVRPRTVCLCGSTKFRDQFAEANRALTLSGRIVLAPGVFAHADGVPITEDDKTGLDKLHLAKIDASDEVFVVNVGGYIGSSTANEIAYATAHGKPISYLEQRNATGGAT